MAAAKKLPRGWKLVAVGRRDAKVQRAITRGLIAFNDVKVGRWPFRHLTVSVRDAKGRIQGGLHGMVYWGWLFVNYFWLDEKARGHGVGAACIAAAEGEALKQGCHGLWLDTGTFQAPGFYRKQGFKKFGYLDGHPPGHGHFWFFKKLKPKRPVAAKPVKPKRTVRRKKK